MEEKDLKQMSSEQVEETEETFLKDLYVFMKQRETPIERIPHLGFKQIDMFLMYKTVTELGGYQQVTAQQLWKKVYNVLGGNPRSTSAATCTRRHYEKLLLPYECHKRGYGDALLFRTPRAQKRFHPAAAFSDFEHEYSRGRGQAQFQHLSSFAQASRSVLGERPRPFFMPLNIGPYFPLAPNQPDAPPPPQRPAHRSPQPLDMLRYLASKYKSSAGWEEPLNLSQKESHVGTFRDTPSSFSPPSKRTRFLNRASSLYSAWSSSVEDEGEDSADEEAQSRSTPPASDVIDLTSGTNPVPRRPSPPSVTLFNRKPPCSDAFTLKARERDSHHSREESPDRAELRNPSPEGSGNMEIQIPLMLLQELIRRGLVSGPAVPGQASRTQDPGASSARRTHADTEEPANLSLRNKISEPVHLSHRIPHEPKTHQSFSPLKMLQRDCSPRPSCPQEPPSRTRRYSQEAPESSQHLSFLRAKLRPERGHAF